MAAPTSRPLEYLEGLPGATFLQLYRQPSTALAIFRRMLPDLGILSSLNLGFDCTNCEDSKMFCNGLALFEGPPSYS